jgi:hypothetical protein
LIIKKKETNFGVLFFFGIKMEKLRPERYQKQSKKV